MVGISRSAFYKYKDAVQPFQDMKAGHIITFYALLKDNPGVLSNFLSIFANSGANILTINQTIPTNGCAGVTISAETSEMVEDLEGHDGPHFRGRGCAGNLRSRPPDHNICRQYQQRGSRHPAGPLFLPILLTNGSAFFN